MTRSWSNVRSSVWLIPVLCVIGGVVLSIGTIAIDKAFDYEIVPRSLTGGPDAALGILTTIAASMVSLTALVLTITMVVVQLAMGQFSPRIVQTFLRDRPSQVAVGLFVATFAHAMIAMREVEVDGDGQVPGVAIVVSYVLVLTSIAMLVLYVDHIGRSLRVSSLIELVGDDTRALLDVHYPEALSTRKPDDQVTAASSGVIVAIDRERLVALASEADCVVRFLAGLGQFVPAGAPFCTIDGNRSRLDDDDVREAVRWGPERTMDEDVAYGFRMLVDMAERSLSDSPFLDPTTAVQCIDRLHDGLRQLATRVFPDGRHRDRHGEVRLIVPSMTWDDFVHLAFDEVRLAGARSPQVTRRLTSAIDDLLRIAPAERRPVLLTQRQLLRDGITGAGLSAADTEFAQQPDSIGIGPEPPSRHPSTAGVGEGRQRSDGDRQ